MYFATHALKIVDKGGNTVPFVPKPAQVRFYEALRAQREAGLPERLIMLKARQFGGSTAVQGTLVRRYTRRANHRALVVAHDSSTAGSLFDMGELMVAHLPAEIRPAIEQRRNAQREKYLKFGHSARNARDAGDIGLNSSVTIDTAKEVAAGRGKTNHSMHLSEVAWWGYASKLLSLLNSVPDEPGTLIVVESTANGMNHFKDLWDAAVRGESGYVPFFTGWHEEEAYRARFPTEEAREEFVAQIGRGDYGEDEQRLMDEFGCTPEQLLWRRQTIVARCQGSLDLWNQEYPASPEDAFIASGRHVFAVGRIKRVIARTSRLRPVEGLLVVGSERERQVGSDRVSVPTSALWTPAEETPLAAALPTWKVWEHPQRQTTLQDARQQLDRGEIDLEQFDRLTALADGDGEVAAGCYVTAVDVMGGEENTSGDIAWHAIEVINHRTLEQVAEWRGRCDADEVALQALLAGLYWNEAWVAVETTGGWGIPVVKDYLWRRFSYRRLYRRTAADAPSDKPRLVLGWDTNRRTKPEMEAGLAELLREANDGIRSFDLANDELLRYVRDSSGKSGPEHGAFSDRLMAYMIAQQVAREKPLPPMRRRGGGAYSYVNGPRDPRTGY